MTDPKIVGQLTRYKQELTMTEEPIAIIELDAPRGRKGYTHVLKDQSGQAIGWLWPIKSRPGWHRLALYTGGQVFKGLNGFSIQIENFPIPPVKETPKEPEYHRPRTAGDLMAFIAHHQLGEEEYFSVRDIVETRSETIFLDNTKWVAVYWVEGGNEGYYVHIDRLNWNQGRQVMEAQNIAVGKYWLVASANKAVALLTPFVHGLVGRP